MSRKQKPNQKTLFESWKKEPKHGASCSNKIERKGEKRNIDADRVAGLVTSEATDMNDDDLIEAAELLESTLDDVPEPFFPSGNVVVENLPGFDKSLGNLWIYPTNYPVRDYQFSIVRNALTKNTLVSLPTGLGKTFIAAVVMYNFYRWYPQGKIVFMAPTKPLVSQQIEACYKIMGIPMEDQAEITGMTTSVYKREALWSSKRVFFLTPQVINNDLARGVCPAEQIKCVVIDEAHKAQGKHAYCQVINQLVSRSRYFRVLALSATPGTDVKSVQQVITNLLISHIEIRSEDSIDIRGFSHQRKVEKVVCKLDETMVKMRDNYLKVIEIFTKSLVSRRALFERETSSYSKYGILMARDQFRKDPPSGLNKYEMGAIEGDFATCISLLHGIELLQQHGMRSFFIFIKAMMEGDKGNMRAKSVLGANPTFRDMYESLTGMFGTSPNPTVLLTQAGQTQQSIQQAGPSSRPTNYVYSHPKIAKLEDVVVQHFQSFIQSHGNDATRVMVFCQYRDSVQEITELLQMHRPLVRPMQFVGHSTASGKIAKFTQKDQLQVVSKFRAGGYNTLISTCVGEEGLDIGDVDLIVCFDAHKSPIRLVQRMGRTGRKRKGRIVMLVTEGKEERDYNSSLSNKKSIQKAITGNSSRSLKFYQHNPRMIPQGLNPKPLKMHITVKEKEEPPKKTNKNKARKTQNMDISTMMKKAEVQQSEYLNPEQMREWDEKLKLSSKEKEQLKTLPAMGRILCLQPKKKVATSDLRELPLSEWTLWQNRLQETKHSGHSSVTKNFVEVMEVCDLIKQSDERDFDENLAPFLGGKYDKSEMESGKKKSKLDGYFATTAKSTKMPAKGNKTTKFVEELLKIDESPLKLSPDDDFVSEAPKKVIPERNNFKNKICMFAATDDDETTENHPNDDTLNGIDSILGDDQDFILKSSNESCGKKNVSQLAKNESPDSEEETPGESDCKNLPDFDMGDWDIDESPEEPRNLLKQTCGREEYNDVEQIQEDEVVTRKDESSPLLDFVDNLSVIPSQTPSNLAKLKQGHLKSDGTTTTPSSFNSISLDFVDHLGSDISDVEESEKKSVPSKKRSCFLLGNSTKSNRAPKIDETPAIGRMPIASESKINEMLRQKTSNDQKNGTELIQSGSTDDHGTADSKILSADVDSNECNDSENIPDGNDDIFDVVANLESLPDDSNHSKININLQGKEKKLPSGIADVAADMFGSEFAVDFDFGDFSDDDINEPSKIDEDHTTSPVLVSKVKRDLSASSDNSNHGIQNRKNVDTSLASLTLSQRVENQLFFADRRKIQSGDEVPVATVKPQMLSKIAAGSELSEQMDENLEPNTEFEMDSRNCNPQQSDQRKEAESLKRKRASEMCDNIPSKRMKEGNSLLASPTMCPNSILKSPLTDQKPSSKYQDSPLLRTKMQMQSKKLIFSPNTSHTQHSRTSEESPALKSKFMSEQSSSARSYLCDADSPIVHSKKVFKRIQQKHSTPKYHPKRTISSDSSEYDDFEMNAKPTCSVKRKTTMKDANRKNAFRGRMKDYLDEEAEVSDDGIRVSSDEDEEMDPEEFEEMKRFVNDDTMLTQHVNDGSTIDEQAMYLQRKPDFYEEEGRFQGHNGKFKLAYGVGNNLDIFSQEVPTDVSGYEEDSFVCNDEGDESDNITALGEVTLLQDTPSIGGKKERMTRRQAELNKLKRMNYNAKQKEPIENSRPGRKRIVCFDESSDSIESGHKLRNPSPAAPAIALSKSDVWSCPACTLINKGTSQICELCDSERPDSVGVTREESSQAWTCTLCTYVNRSKSDVCNMCGEKNGGIHKENATESSTKFIRTLKPDKKEKIVKETPNTSNLSHDNPDIIPPTPVPLDRNVNIKKRLDLGTPVKASKSELSSRSTPGSLHSLGESFSSASNEDREERLKRCKEKQMEFRARMEKRRSGQQSSFLKDGKASTLVHSKSPGFLSSTKASLKFNSPNRSTSDLINSSVSSPVAEEQKSSDKNVVLVDSKELSSSQDILTQLRCKHNVHVTVASLPHCDYIVGRGTAVERRVISDLSQSSNRQKLASRFQQLNFHYDRIYLIIEQDRLKKKGFGQSDGRNAHNSQYISTLCSLASTNIRILYSDNQEETANILVMLACREKGLKRSIDLAAAVKADNAKSRSLVRLYSSIPRVSFVSALYMCLNFKNLKELSSSSVEKLIQKAHMSTSSAAEVYSFFRRRFDLQMTPSR